MKYEFINHDTDKKILLKNEESNINSFLLENSTKAVSLIYDFFNNNNRLLLVNGFMGSGKTAVVAHAGLALAKDVIVLAYNCFETTQLDDILLAFFEEFRKLTILGKIDTPKIKSENFIQKINSYFETVKKPILIVLNGFESVLKVNKTPIMEFLKHIYTFENAKTILISRIFDLEDFAKLKYEKVTVLALEKSIFEKYLRSENFKQIGPLSDELYKHTRGYFFYVSLSIKIMQLRQLSLIDFLDGFSKSFLTFNDFILREALSLVDPVSGHLFRFLTIMRHPVSIKLLKALQLWNEEKVLFFVKKMLLVRFEDYIYLPDYYKVIAENSIPENVSIKLHQGCVDLYNTQLPLKPLERDITISRQTMRNEIEYHSMFIPRKSEVVNKDIIKNSEYIEYSQTVKPIETTEPVLEDVENKDEKIKKMSFIFDDDEFGVLDKIADSIKNFMTYSEIKNKQEKDESKLNLQELLNLAKEEEENFNFKHAASLYSKSLIHKNDEDYYTYLPFIYTRLAQCYQKLSDWFDAQKYFELAQEFYEKAGDVEKSCEMKYSLANIFYMTFKKDEAKKILNEIKDKTISNELQIKVLLMSANLNNNSNIIYSCYKQALEIDTQNVDKTLLAELYYKFALVSEEIEDDENALLYYKKCIKLDVDNNPRLADALSNVAQLYDDIGESEAAIKYYKESLIADEKNKNLNGLYASNMKLAEIYRAKDTQQAIEYYNTALKYAKELNEKFYIISTATDLGDLYFNKKQNELAYKYYMIAYEYVKDDSRKENLARVTMRLNEIKARVGEERFKEFEK